ncbi:MAG: imidazolonepropionase [Bacteroidetes bacterium]|nr:imidazolonepropionase [Bacteroidota bacterium]MCW5896534.1 imidazolonepropionase [Bacteroidota bacterium]
MNLFIKNISQLVTVAARGARTKAGAEMRELGILNNSGVLCESGKISWVGEMRDWNRMLPDGFAEINASGKVVLPGFVDSHTHMMFAGNRAHEFALRSQGATYQQIAEAGGGILNTITHVRAATKKELKKHTLPYMNAMMKHGTTTVEIKSGYGLDFDSEVKMLEAINELKDEEMMTVVSTFIGAHAYPPEYKQDKRAYADVILEKMIPYVGKKKLAMFCDVFCERGYFEIEDSERILNEGKKWGMLPKVHAEELNPLGGAVLAARVGAVSADHLEHVTDEGITALREAGVVGTLLPGVSFFLNHGFAPARKLIDGGVAVAIASDFNPGSCMSYSMPMMMTIACTQMKMTPEETLVASTLNAAAALNMSSTVGSIEVGKNADVIIADVPDWKYLAYHFGTNHIVTTIKNGTILEL